jgi:hypothetical protein
MVRVLMIGFLIAHGLVHMAIWAPPKSTDGKAPFDPATSWLLGDQRTVALVLALLATALLIAGGVGLWSHANWWRPASIAGLSISFALMVLYFHPWFVPIQLVNLALIIALVWQRWPARAAVG